MKRQALTCAILTLLAALAAGRVLGPVGGIAAASIVVSALSALVVYRTLHVQPPTRAERPEPQKQPTEPDLSESQVIEAKAASPGTPLEHAPDFPPQTSSEDNAPLPADTGGEDVGMDEDEGNKTENIYSFSDFAKELLLSEEPIELLKETVAAINEREHDSDQPAPIDFERYLARRLVEAGINSSREDERLPSLRVVRPRHSGLFYLRIASKQISYGAQLRLIRIEAALNAALLASRHAPRAEQSGMEELYKYTQRLEQSLCGQAPNVDMADWSYLAMPWQVGYGPADQGEWAVRQTIAEAIESLQTPYRLEASFRTNVQAGDVGMEIAVTPPQACWKSAFVDGLGVVETTSEMRAKAASSYAARLAILLANHAFRASNHIKRVWVSGIERTPTKRICRYSVCFDRRSFSRLQMDAIRNPIQTLTSFGASVKEEAGRLLPTAPLFYLEDERFCPTKRHDLWLLSERPLSTTAAISLGATRVSDLSIHEELPRLLAYERVLRRLDVQDDTLTTEQSVHAVLSVSQEMSDFSVLSASERIMRKLVNGTLDPTDVDALHEEYMRGDHLSKCVQRAQRLLGSQRPDEALTCLLDGLRDAHGQESYGDTDSVVYRSFETFAQRSLYNRLHASDKRAVILVPDAYVVAQLLVAALYMNMPEDAAEYHNALENARTHAQKALDVAPLSTPAHLSVASCMERQGELDLASKQIASLLEVAFDPQSIGMAYYHLASVQWSLGNQGACQACYQLSAQAFPPLLPFVMHDCQELLAQGATFAELLDAHQIEQELERQHIPLSPSERLAFLLYDCATASIDAEVFPVARDLMRALEILTGDDVIRCIRQSLEREPDI